MNYYVYILLCNDDSFYVGYTSNLKLRLANHNSGHGSDYLHSKLPVKMVYSEACESKEAALKREKQIKNWSRVKKIKLINADFRK